MATVDTCADVPATVDTCADVPAACSRVVASAATMTNWLQEAGLCCGGFIFLLLESGDGWGAFPLSCSARATEQAGRGRGRGWSGGGGLAAACRVCRGTGGGREEAVNDLAEGIIIDCITGIGNGACDVLGPCALDAAVAILVYMPAIGHRAG